MGSAPPERAGSAASLSETSGELGVAMGVATLGSLGTAVYRDQVSDTLPTDIPAGAAEAARDTLAGAVAAAERLPAGDAAELSEPAREAFVSGLNVVAAVSAAAVVVFAVLAMAVLRRVRAGTEPANSPTQN